MSRYILYARKSTEDKTRQIQSIPDQINALRQLAAIRGCEIVAVIEDEKSAKDIGRKGFSSLIERIKNGEAQGILCWNIDRLSRNPKDSGELMWMLQKGIIEAIITPERTYYPDDSSILLSVETGRSTDYVRKLSTDVKRGMKSKIEQGWLPCRAPVGYRNEREGVKGRKRILPDEPTFVNIRTLWRHLLKNRVPLAELYRFMQSTAPVHVHGDLIAFSSFCRIFRNPFYAGVFTWNGETHVGAHTAMVTQKQFEEVQEMLSGKSAVRQQRDIFPFKGLFRCETCGACITAERHSKRVKYVKEPRHYDYYRCCHTKKGVECREKPMSSKKVEDKIIEEILHLYLPKEIIEFGLMKMRHEPMELEDDPQAEELKRSIRIHEHGIHTMEQNIAMESNAETRAIIKKQIERSQVKVLGYKQELEQLHNKPQALTQEVEDALQLLLVAQDKFQNGSDEERREVVRTLGSNWRIAGQTLVYDPNIVPAAVRKVRERYQLKNPSLEPLKSQSESGVTCCLSDVDAIWSG
jgi:site-specific DNA recombinase